MDDTSRMYLQSSLKELPKEILEQNGVSDINSLTDDKKIEDLVQKMLETGSINVLLNSIHNKFQELEKDNNIEW
jgi:hypothetical protein